MPTATLSFQLPEEQQEHQIALDGWRYRAALNALDDGLRQLGKYGSEKQLRDFSPELARQWLWDALADQGVAERDLA